MVFDHFAWWADTQVRPYDYFVDGNRCAISINKIIFTIERRAKGAPLSN
jgi:hypothetical protein